MSEYIELTEPCGLLTVPGVREYVCRLEPVGDDTVNVTVCAPTEPIVRCRDCTKAECSEVHLLNGMKQHILTCARFQNFPHGTQPDGFCAWGEVRVGSSKVRVGEDA